MYHKKTSIMLLLLILFTSAPLAAEYVFLKDGSIIQGQITSDTTTAIIIRDKEKKNRTIQRTDIMRILYTDIYLGKIYVQKIDGKNEICYMVDEDRDTYTFRKELYSPEEFTLRRDQVLFIARGNPTGLEGEADTDKIELKWFPPYNPIKSYRLYVKTGDDKEFKVAGETKSKSYTLKNLKSNTKFILYVTAMDSAGDESLPSNELTITTLNIKPERPVKLRYEKRDVKVTTGENGKKKDKEETKKFVAWDPVTDPDGTVRGYNVYYLKEDKEEKIATIIGTEFEIPDDKSVYDLRITAVDDKNDESPASRVKHPRALKIMAQPLYFMPMGTLADMFDPGFGGLVYIGFKNFFMQNLEFGISCGAVKLPGKDADKIDGMLFVPVTFDAGYNFTISETFSIMPYVSAGYTYMNINYTAFYEEKNKKTWEPVSRAGVMVNMEFEYIQVSAGGCYGFIYETAELKPFIEVYIRTGVLIDL